MINRNVKGGNSGECYYSSKESSQSTGCFLAVEGYDVTCEITGESLKA